MADKLKVSLSTEPTKSLEELIEYAKQMEGYADFMHCDVMDGKFVEKSLLLPSVVAKLKANTILPLDVHLMTINNLKLFEEYILAGADYLTIHYEIFDDENQLVKTLNYIKSKNVKCGVSIKPNTSVEKLESTLKFVDLVLIMSVEPGKGGQTFLENSYQKVASLKEMILKQNLNVLISVDGGVNSQISKILKQNGADIVVSGSYVFKSKNRIEAINNLKNN